MSKKSTKRSKAIDRPFDPEILRRATNIAGSYQIVIQCDDGEYFGRGLEMPNVMNDRKTPDECAKATRDILSMTVAYMLETGQVPPSPASSDGFATSTLGYDVK